MRQPHSASLGSSSGNEAYGQLARRILLDCAAWDPVGSTGYRYNDEAGMPYAYHFSRTYSFIHDLLSEEEREKCRQVMQVRGNEMYRHLYPRHLWRPYASHSNRAWHFLGEVAIAFHDEIEEADDWLWFAMNVFYNTYPVWSRRRRRLARGFVVLVLLHRTFPVVGRCDAGSGRRASL